jgi:hypothetical protein
MLNKKMSIYEKKKSHVKCIFNLSLGWIQILFLKLFIIIFGLNYEPLQRVGVPIMASDNNNNKS